VSTHREEVGKTGTTELGMKKEKEKEKEKENDSRDDAFS
jgi:hypothetical protein